MFYEKDIDDFKRGLLKINTNIGVIFNSSKESYSYKLPTQERARRTAEKNRKGYYVNNFLKAGNKFNKSMSKVKQ